MIQGHGRVETWGTGANLADVPAVAADDAGADADRPAADGDGLADAVAAAHTDTNLVERGVVDEIALRLHIFNARELF